MTTSSENHFGSLVQRISETNPFQRKKIENLLADKNSKFIEEANEKLRILLKTLPNGIQPTEGIELIAQYFNKMSLDFLREQIKFQRSHCYPIASQAVARASVYDSVDIMTYYMYGLFASYYLWPNHNKILNFFKATVEKMDQKNNQLEVAPGHGLFTYIFRSLQPDCHSTLIDISSTSLEISRKFLDASGVNRKVSYVCNDFVNFQANKQFDFIVMGEVLEHVEDPGSMLAAAKSVLSNDGEIFITTCTDAPAIDHVYHFKAVDEIRDVFASVGLRIKSELCIPTDFESVELCETNRATVNYCALLSR